MFNLNAPRCNTYITVSGCIVSPPIDDSIDCVDPADSVNASIDPRDPLIDSIGFMDPSNPCIDPVDPLIDCFDFIVPVNISADPTDPPTDSPVILPIDPIDPIDFIDPDTVGRTVSLMEGERVNWAMSNVHRRGSKSSGQMTYTATIATLRRLRLLPLVGTWIQ